MIGLVLFRYQSNCLMDTNVFQDDCSEFKSWSMSYMSGMRKSYITHTDVFLILHQTFNYMYQQKISPHCDVGTKRSGISKAIFLETPLPQKQTKFFEGFLPQPLIFLIWPILEARAEILQKISFAFWAMEFQENLLLIFPDL